MFSLTVCDHIMIAHSFQGEEFGPAQRMHGATFAVEAEFRAPALDRHQLLVDIGLAKTALRKVLDTVDYSNLDENPLLTGINTTTEYMAFHIHGLVAAACADGRLGDGGRAVAWLKILLREAPTAWAAFEGPITTGEA
jgi:6-pyruvoyl-tetrahydropterin synthase